MSRKSIYDPVLSSDNEDKQRYDHDSYLSALVFQWSHFTPWIYSSMIAFNTLIIARKTVFQAQCSDNGMCDIEKTHTVCLQTAEKKARSLSHFSHKSSKIARRHISRFCLRDASEPFCLGEQSRCPCNDTPHNCRQFDFAGQNQCFKNNVIEEIRDATSPLIFSVQSYGGSRSSFLTVKYHIVCLHCWWNTGPFLANGLLNMHL